MLDADVRRFGRDLRLPEAGEDDLTITASGDVSTRAGRGNLAAAIRRRICTSPGDLTHRPRFGAGLLDRLEGSTAPAARAALANAIRANLLQDPRIAEVSVVVEAGTDDDAQAAALTVTVTYRAAQEEVSETLSFEFSE